MISARAIAVQGVGYRPAILAAQGFLSVEEVAVEALRGHQRHRGRIRYREEEPRSFTATAALVDLRARPLAERLAAARDMLARDAHLTVEPGVEGARLLISDAKRYVELVGQEIEALAADDTGLVLMLNEALDDDAMEKIAVLLAIADEL